jgi:VIT1/CCC1 family predicted Fe2+/Mn2+ transporter
MEVLNMSAATLTPQRRKRMQVEEKMKKYGGKCRTCQHWIPPIGVTRNPIRGWYDNTLESYDYTTGRCIRNSILAYSDPVDVQKNGISSSADKSCAFWEINLYLKGVYEQYLAKNAREEKERAEKERKLKEEEAGLIKAAESGDSEAQFKLGSFYKTHYRSIEASIWFKKAAGQGHARASLELAMMENRAATNKRNKIIRSIIGSILGGILGFIRVFTMLHPEINVIAIIIGTIVCLVCGFFIGKTSDSVFGYALLGAVLFGITFVIFHIIFLPRGLFMGIVSGAFFGAIGGALIGISCIKLGETKG